MEKKILKPADDTQSSTLGNRSTFIPINSSIEDNDSNFIFFFGEPTIGKSVILAATLYYMNARAGTIRPKLSTPNTKEAEVLLYDMLDGIAQGVLPNRTVRDQVTRLDLIFEPNSKSKKVKPISLTFLEMSGENLQTVRRGGSLHKSIDEYLNAEIPITFLLVTDYEQAARNDALVISFLQKLEKERRKYKRVNALLIIAKWDKSGNQKPRSEQELDAFVKERMPMTNNQIDNYELSKTYFSVGEFLIDTENKEKLVRLNLESSQILTEWLYESITGVDINYEGTIWERIFG